MRRVAAVLCLGVAACSRSWISPSAVPHIASIDDRGGVFAGQTAVVHGSGFNPAASVVTVDLAPAQIVADGGAAPSATALEIIVPALAAPGEAQVVVSVNGELSNPQALDYLGVGHPVAMDITSGGDLSPTPTDVSALGPVRLLSLLGNESLVLAEPSAGVDVTFALNPDTLPFETRVLPAVDLDGSAGLALFAGAIRFAPDAGPAGDLITGTFRVDVQPWDGGVSLVDALGALEPSVPAPLATFIPGVDSALDYPPATSAPALSFADGGVEVIASDSVTNFCLPDAGASDAGCPGPRGIPPLGTLTAAILQTSNAPLSRVLDRHLLEPLVAPLDAGAGIPLVAIDAGAVVPFALSVEPDGAAAWLMEKSSHDDIYQLARLDFASESVTPVGQASLIETDGVVASGARVALWARANSKVRLFDFSGQPVVEVELPGELFRLRRDQLPPYHFLAVVASPPSLVEFDDDGQIVSTEDLSNTVVLSSIDASGQRIAAWMEQFPALSILSAGNLGPGPFQAPSAPDEPRDMELISSTWRGLPDGGEELCGAFRAIDTQSAKIVCGPPDALFTASTCELAPSAFVPDGGGEPENFAAQIFGFADGRLRVFGAGSIWDCPPGCPSSCARAGDYADGTAEALAVTPRGNALAAVADGSGDEELEWVDPPGAPRVLCLGSDPKCPLYDQETNPVTEVVVDPQQRYAAVLGHLSSVYSLGADGGPVQALGSMAYTSDIPTVEAFSPDGTRLYVGTILGRLDEYDLSDLAPSNRLLTPARSAVIDQGVRQILAYPDGSRLVLTGIRGDQLYVVR